MQLPHRSADTYFMQEISRSLSKIFDNSVIYHPKWFPTSLNQTSPKPADSERPFFLSALFMFVSLASFSFSLSHFLYQLLLFLTSFSAVSGVQWDRRTDLRTGNQMKENVSKLSCN